MKSGLKHKDGRAELCFEDYLDYSRRKSILLIVLGAVLAGLAVLSLTIGDMDISAGEVLHILFSKGDGIKDIVIWNWRLPIVIGAIIIGASLGVAGAVMQCILKNPLGSPYTLGLSSAAAFGASMGIMITNDLLPISASGPYVVTLCAFVWSMVATGFIILMAKYTNISAESMVLAGVAISSIFSAGVSAFQYFSSDSALASIVFWQFGDVTKISWTEVGIILMALIGSCLYFYYKRWDYNALDAGDETARCLGIDVNSSRIVGMVIASTLTAIVVSFAGVIGFIGLLGPHIIRRILGNDHRYLIPGSILVGALILLVSNLIGQNAFDFVMPVGIITSFLGGPLFLYILLKSYKTKRRC